LGACKSIFGLVVFGWGVFFECSFEWLLFLNGWQYYVVMDVQVPLPVIIAKEGEWFVASCPVLDIATQGKTEKEVKEMMEDLINDYFKDPDTPKPEMKTIMSVSLTNIPVKVPEGVLHKKASSTSTA